MEAKFCWEYRDCSKSCQVKTTQSLFCWRIARTGYFQSPEVCFRCEYRNRWMVRDFSLQEFVESRGRRRGNRGRKRILVVDDEPNILYALEETVTGAGYDCLGAPDGEEGLFLARETLPDLIISDVIMPKVNGYDLCRSLKKDAATSHIPVILITVRGMVKDIEEGRSAGADDYIIKPFHAQDLETKIGAFLTSQPSEST